MRLHFSLYFLLLIFSLTGCKSKKVEKIEEQHYIINTNTIDSSIYYKILPYKKEMDGKMNIVVGKTDIALIKEQPEGLLGNFVADCLFKQCRIYLGKDSSLLNAIILNNGGLRTSLPQGEITVGKVYELMPFDNELVMVQLSGAKTMEMMNFIAEKGGIPVSGISMKIDGAKAKEIKINGKDLDPDGSYYVISSDYLAGGGDKYDFFKNAISSRPLKKLIRDAIIEYCKDETAKGRTLTTKLDGRISIAK
jgi:2',3'-cyclic-nucleotide 2'-phosphodiesterase (5'-nucleotidase family)